MNVREMEESLEEGILEGLNKLYPGVKVKITLPFKDLDAVEEVGGK